MVLAEILSEVSRFLDQHEHGWCTEEKAHALAAAIYTLRPEIIVEVGVWSGRSLIPMAIACREYDGTVIAIDPWEPRESVIGQDATNSEWWGNVNHEEIYQYFLKQYQTWGLNNIDVRRMPSDKVKPPSHISFLHIDGNHGDQEIRDVRRFASKVRAGGLCFVDDIAWQDREFQVVLEEMDKLGFVEVYRVDSGAMFQRS